MTDTETRPPTSPDAPGTEQTAETSAEERNRRDQRSSSAPALGPREALRFVWTQLTSMRTALVLLFALALAAIPGSLIPQRSISPIRVSEWIRTHPTLGPVYDQVGLFQVYSSPWFSAIYLLLFVSLLGCIIPRIMVYARALRAEPTRTPRRLTRLPVSRTAEVDESPTVVLDRAEAALRKQRYRVRRRTDEHGDSVSAERGYLREAGNLVFHVSLIFVLLGVAITSLIGYRGSAVVVVGNGFSNSSSQYDDFSSGGAFRESMLKPFTVVVEKFIVRFEGGPVQTGAARQFTATMQVTDAPGATPQTETLEVNHPLTVDGTTVHLLGHGYAPVVTVKDGHGDVAYSGPVPFLPQDGNFTSVGVIKVPDGRPDRLAFQGIFVPSGVDGGQPISVFPDWLNPLLYLNAYAGPPKEETGAAESIYSLDATGLTQFKDGDQPLRFALKPGQTRQLPDGKGSIRFDGVDRWVKLQIGYAPGIPLIVGSVAVAVTGLCLSLFVRPRRIWVRAKTQPAVGAGGPEGATRTLVELGGLDRADARTGLDDDLDELTLVAAGNTARSSDRTAVAHPLED